jgi:uncharacterized protein YjbI with pentapeptide repeats
LAGPVIAGMRTCTECTGIAITEDSEAPACLRHAPPKDRDRVFNDLRAGKPCTATRGLSLDQDLLDQILRHTRKRKKKDDAEKRPQLVDADFRSATFTSDVRFAEVLAFGNGTAVVFAGPCDFEGAVFEGDADFSDVTFEDAADFRAATFRGRTSFDGCLFAGIDKVDDSESNDGYAHMLSLTRFEAATFSGGPTSFNGTVACGTVDFTRSTFTSVDLGPLFCPGIRLRHAAFTQPARIVIAGSAQTPATVELSAVVFLASAVIEGYNADIQLSSVDFTAASTIRKWTDITTGERPGTPMVRLRHLRRCNLHNIVAVADVDLSLCEFQATTNLDRLRLEAGTTFLTLGGAFRTRRRVIAQECQWRFWMDKNWKGPDFVGWRRSATPFEANTDMHAAAVGISEVYRALRKSREDNRDEPGAADFYYGEMDMRRASTRGAERFLLTLYWAMSGYGLRAWRAYAGLAAVVATFWLLFLAYGFTGPAAHSPTTAFLYTLSTATAFLSNSDTKLTFTGEILKVLLRLVGPLLLGLAALPIRARIKR